MIRRAHPGVVIFDRLYVGPVQQADGAPIIDGSTSTVKHADGIDHYFHGITVQPRRNGRAFAIALHGFGPGPWPARWRFIPRWLVRVRG